MNEILNQVKVNIVSRKARSAWDKGVKATAIELLERIDDEYLKSDDVASSQALHARLLNGAKDWSHYAWSGCGLCYNYDIAWRFCNPTELKVTREGMRRPNRREEWPDVYARGLYQAECLIMEAYDAIKATKQEA